jgi:hypothetical protein
MSARDELDPFDADLFAIVGDEHGVDADRLRELTRTHQSNVRDLPGVEDIVYEWRSQFHWDPLLAQTAGAYYLALPDHVWDEFAESLDASDTEREALVALHERQIRRDAPEVGIDTGRLDGSDGLLLVRE